MSLHHTILVSCHIQDSPQAIPLATSILKSFCQSKNELSVSLIDFYLNQKPDQAAEQILLQKPDSVGFSIYIWNRVFIEKTIKIIKKSNKEILIYGGGAEVTATVKDLSTNTNFDYLIAGEGEIPFSRLMDYFLHNNIEKPEKILKKDHLKDLNKIPSPFLTGNLNPSSWDGILWELSRGCPFNCAFCSESRGIDGVRYFSEERIISELKYFEEQEVDQIFVLDPTFNVNKKRAKKIISLIKEQAPLIHYTFEIRAELLDEEMAREFSEIHCSLQIGLQSSDNDVLLKLNRTINKEIFSDRIALLNKYGAVFGLDLIYGLPGDNLEGFKNSLDYALNLIPNHLDIFRLSVFPGTELYEKSEAFRIVFQKSPPYSVISTPEYSIEDLIESEIIANAVELFYNKGRSAAWLLSVTEILDAKPSVFFNQFAQFILETDIDHKNIYELQSRFLIQEFTKNGKLHYLPVAIDLSLFHHLYGEVIHAPNSDIENQKEKEFSIENIYTRSSLLRNGIFSHDVTLYSEMGMIEIESFSLNYDKEISYGLIFDNGFEISTMAVEESLYKFVIGIDGKRSIREICQTLKLEVDEIQDFIDYLIDYSLIIPVL
ncbi:MAG: B12-binding domain-containing radical SAM protein [Spirochaetaceae bacterium]|jgi:radical SAM superfamily enzyme YgiQ (UPF0313 family)|nr:B12-binding domain-containing radical SAM protein [Spirochaetaceae bacterium]